MPATAEDQRADGTQHDERERCPEWGKLHGEVGRTSGGCGAGAEVRELLTGGWTGVVPDAGVRLELAIEPPDQVEHLFRAGARRVVDARGTRAAARADEYTDRRWGVPFEHPIDAHGERSSANGDDGAVDDGNGERRAVGERHRWRAGRGARHRPDQGEHDGHQGDRQDTHVPTTYRSVLRFQQNPRVVTRVHSGTRWLTAVMIIASVLITGCQARPASPLPAVAVSFAPRPFVISTDLGNGQVELTVLSVYPYAELVRIPVAIRTIRGTITGPLNASVLANGFGGNGTPSQVLVRQLAVTAIGAAAGQRSATEITWDGRDELGVLVPPDTYSVVLEFGIVDGSLTRRGIAGATLQFGQ